MRNVMFLLVLYIASCNADSGDNVKVLEFQPDMVPTINSNAIYDLSAQRLQIQILSAFSVCHRLLIYQFRPSSFYAFSYATSDKKSNELNFGLRRNRFLLSVGGWYKYSSRNVAFTPNRWYHFCATIDADMQKITFYLDGYPEKESNLTDSSFRLNGSFVLGQETDALNGGFSAPQSFSGRMTEFNIYNRVLSADEVKELASCETTPDFENAAILSWTKTNWQLNEVYVLSLPRHSFCSQAKKAYKLMPHRMSRKKSQTFCRNFFDSPIFVPSSEEENQDLYEEASKYTAECKAKNHATAFLWIGLTDLVVEGVWMDDQDQIRNYSNFREGNGINSHDCVALEAPPFAADWNDVTCSDGLSLCFACQKNDNSLLHLRGVCFDSLDEHLFVFDGFNDGNQLRSFRGFVRYSIDLDPDGKTWILMDLWNQQKLATSFIHDGSYPLGTHPWTIQQDYVLCNLQQGTVHSLTF